VKLACVALGVFAFSPTAFAASKDSVPAANRVNAHDQPLFEALCGKGNDVWVNGTHGCARCPAYTSGGSGEPPQPLAPGEKPELYAWPVLQVPGAFTRSGARQQMVVLAAANCESHAANFGGSVLLDRAGATTVVEYDRGFMPTSCKAHSVDGGRNAVLCETAFSQAGIVEQSLVLRDFSEPWDENVDHALFTLESDETNVCSTAADADQGPFLMSSLKDFGWADTNHDGRADAVATIQYVRFAMAGPLRKHCADLAAFWKSAHHTAQLSFEADASGQFVASEGTRAALRESAGLNTGAP